MASSLLAQIALRATRILPAHRRAALGRSQLLAMALVMSCLGVNVDNAIAIESTWIGGPGSWTDPSWDTSPIFPYPTNGSPPGFTYSAIIDDDVTLDIGVFIDNLTITELGGIINTLDIHGGGGAIIQLKNAGAGTVDNAGMLVLESGGELSFDGSGVVGTPMGTLTGGGMVMMSGGTLGGSSAATETVTTDNTIMGYGAVGAKNLINHGIINANMPMHTLIVSAGAAGSVKNVGTGVPGTGFLMATGGGTLALQPGTFDNTDPTPTHVGTISATGGSEITLGASGGLSTTIIGGTLSADPLSDFKNTYIATLKGVTLAPGTSYLQADSTITNLEGAIANGGVISVTASGMAGTSLLVLDAGDVTFSGMGTIFLKGTPTFDPFNPNFVKTLGIPTERLTMGKMQSIIGRGQFGSHARDASTKLTNHGTITASTPFVFGAPQGMTFYPPIIDPVTMLPIPDALINDGMMEADDNAFLTFDNGIVTNSSAAGGGKIVAHGMAVPGMVILQAGVVVNGGTILLDGPMSQLQLNSATARPATLTNTSGGMIFTVAPSTTNTLGGAITNSFALSIVVKDNSSLTLDNASLPGGSVNNSSIIQVGMGGVGIGPSALTIKQGVLNNAPMGMMGTILVVANGTLNLNGIAGLDSTINGGTVSTTAPLGTINLNGGTIHGGMLTNFGGAIGGAIINVVPGATGTLGGTVNNNLGATINVLAGSTLNLETTGSFFNFGMINVNAAAGSNLCPKGTNGTVTLDGSGLVNLLGAGSGIFGATNGSETLVNLNNTIAGGGTIGQGKLALINRGVISATNGAAGLTIQPNSAGVTNSGTIQANGGPLTLASGTLTNYEGATNGFIQTLLPGDMITVSNATIDGGNVNILPAGIVLLSNGTIHNGLLNVGPAGLVTTGGNTTNTLGGTIVNPMGGTISVGATSTLMLETGGSYNNSGLLTINEGPAGSPAALKINGAGGTVTLMGGGTVTMVAGGGGGNTISGVAGNERLINLDNKINGTGQIGLHTMSLTNDGTIDASVVPGITITTNSGGVINGGFLQASSGATLTLDGGIYTNTIGMIRAQTVESGAEVDLKSGVTINGGTVNNNGGDLIRVVDEAVLNTLTNKGNIAQNEGSILDLIGTITNKGTITMPATNFVTQIKLLSGDVTLGGSGKVELLHSPLNQIIAANGLDRLTVGSSQTVDGTGNIGVGMMALTNNGKIIADQPTALTIQPNLSGFLNTGTLQSAAGSTLNVVGGYTQTAGDTNVIGTLDVTAGPLTAGGGTLSGSGPSNISGGFSLTGNVTKLDSGTATISGPENFNSRTTLAINGGIVKFNVNSGPVTVGSGVTASVASGAQLELAGTVSALAAASGRVNVANNSSTPGVLVSGKNQQVGGIDGSGTVAVNVGSDLTANHIIQTSLMIGGTAASAGAVTIAPSDASGNPLVPAAAEGAGDWKVSGFVIKADDILLSSDVPPGAPIAGAAALLLSDSALHGTAGVNGSPIPGAAFMPEGNVVVGSTAVVPEPSAAVLLGLASLIWSIIGFRRRTSRLGAL